VSTGAHYLMAIGQLLDHPTQLAKLELFDQQLSTTDAQRRYVHLQVARLDSHVDAQLVPADGSLGMLDKCIGEQLSVGNAIGWRCGFDGSAPVPNVS